MNQNTEFMEEHFPFLKEVYTNFQQSERTIKSIGLNTTLNNTECRPCSDLEDIKSKLDGSASLDPLNNINLLNIGINDRINNKDVKNVTIKIYTDFLDETHFNYSDQFIESIFGNDYGLNRNQKYVTSEYAQTIRNFNEEINNLSRYKLLNFFKKTFEIDDKMIKENSIHDYLDGLIAGIFKNTDVIKIVENIIKKIFVNILSKKLTTKPNLVATSNGYDFSLVFVDQGIQLNDVGVFDNDSNPGIGKYCPDNNCLPKITNNDFNTVSSPVILHSTYCSKSNIMIAEDDGGWDFGEFYIVFPEQQSTASVAHYLYEMTTTNKIQVYTKEYGANSTSGKYETLDNVGTLDLNIVVFDSENNMVKIPTTVSNDPTEDEYLSDDLDLTTFYYMNVDSPTQVLLCTLKYLETDDDNHIFTIIKAFPSSDAREMINESTDNPGIIVHIYEEPAWQEKEEVNILDFDEENESYKLRLSNLKTIDGKRWSFGLSHEEDDWSPKIQYQLIFKNDDDYDNLELYFTVNKTFGLSYKDKNNEIRYHPSTFDYYVEPYSTSETGFTNRADINDKIHDNYDSNDDSDDALFDIIGNPLFNSIFIQAVGYDDNGKIINGSEEWYFMGMDSFNGDNDDGTVFNYSPYEKIKNEILEYIHDNLVPLGDDPGQLATEINNLNGIITILKELFNCEDFKVFNIDDFSSIINYMIANKDQLYSDEYIVDMYTDLIFSPLYNYGQIIGPCISPYILNIKNIIKIYDKENSNNNNREIFLLNDSNNETNDIDQGTGLFDDTPLPEGNGGGRKVIRLIYYFI